MFKHIRILLKGIIEETNARRTQKQQGFIRDFSDRRAPDFYFFEEKLPFQLECLYKSLKDGEAEELPCNEESK